MLELTRWDPFWNFRRHVYQSALAERPRFGFPVDVKETDQGFVLEASVPGLKAGNISVTVEDGVLHIRAERSGETESEDGRVILRERRTGSVSRALTLPESVDPDNVEAHLADGRLSLTVPYSEERAPKIKEIPVHAG